MHSGSVNLITLFPGVHSLHNSRMAPSLKQVKNGLMAITVTTLIINMTFSSVDVGSDMGQGIVLCQDPALFKVNNFSEIHSLRKFIVFY